MATGRPPGCWVSPELLAAVRAESRAKDGGRQARLERAARTVAVLRGLGYAGAYIGGTHDAAQIAWIIRRADELAPRWEAMAAELAYGAAGGFYLPTSTRPVPTESRSARWPGEAARPRVEMLPRVLDWLGRAFPVNRETWLRRALRRVFAWVDRSKPAAVLVERVELAIKRPLFGCQACGNCVLGHLEYVCPQTCPKQLRNGPCGGTDQGRCEVVPDKPCIWVAVYDRAKAAGSLEGLRTYVPPPDRRLRDTSSWINYFLDRDSRPAVERP
jgi:methylenetetrahydrofolate reductase (NADPH)